MASASRSPARRRGRSAEDRDTPSDFFPRLAAHWKRAYTQHPAGWTAWVLSPDMKLPGAMRLKAVAARADVERADRMPAVPLRAGGRLGALKYRQRYRAASTTAGAAHEDRLFRHRPDGRGLRAPRARQRPRGQRLEPQPAKARALEALGARAFDDPAAALAGAERIHLSLADDASVDAVLEPIAAAIPASHLDRRPHHHRGAPTAERVARWNARGQDLRARAGVHGARQRAEGTGLMLVSGEKSRHDALLPALQQMTGKVLYLGAAPERAAAFKLFGNLTLIGILGVLGDVNRLAHAVGISTEEAFSLFQHFNPGQIAAGARGADRRGRVQHAVVRDRDGAQGRAADDRGGAARRRRPVRDARRGGDVRRRHRARRRRAGRGRRGALRPLGARAAFSKAAMIEQHLDIATADGAMNSFVVHPEEGGPFPVVLFYMDAPGKREELHDMARRLAAVGYYVVLPNLYYRHTRDFQLMERTEAGDGRRCSS